MSTPTKYTPAVIRLVKKCLKHHEDIHDALPDIKKATGINATIPALDGAFRRAGEGSPWGYLRVPKNKEELAPKDALQRKIDTRQAKKDKHTQALTEMMLEKMTLAIESVEPSRIEVVSEMPPTTCISGGKPEIIWVEVSDVQLGTKVEIEKMGGINAHDWAIFLRKLESWKEGVKATIRERLLARPCEGVVIAFLGDIVEGHNIFKGQTYELDADIYKQAFKGAEDFAVAVAEIAATFPHLAFTVYGVGGNHGRVGAYGEAPYRCNWDLVLYEFMRLRWQAAGLTNVQTHFPQAWFQLVDTWGWKHLLVHLDDVKGSLGLPFYGLQRYLGKNVQMLQRVVNYLHGGHFHAETNMSISLGEVLVNGNWIGANSFSKIIVEANTPVQMIHGFTEDNGLEWSKKVYLRTRKDMKPRLTIYKHGKTNKG